MPVCVKIDFESRLPVFSTLFGEQTGFEINPKLDSTSVHASEQVFMKMFWFL